MMVFLKRDSSQYFATVDFMGVMPLANIIIHGDCTRLRFSEKALNAHRNVGLDEEAGRTRTNSAMAGLVADMCSLHQHRDTHVGS